MHADEREFYDAVEEYIRTGYNALEKIEDPTHRRAIGFILTSFQKMNASSLRAIRAALNVRLDRLEKKLEQLPAEEEEEDRDARYEGEQEEQAALKSDREMLQGEIAVLKKLLAMPVRREKKIERVHELLKQIDQENPGTRVLFFTEYRRTQEFLRAQLEEWYGNGTVVLILPRPGASVRKVEVVEPSVRMKRSSTPRPVSKLARTEPPDCSWTAS